jgi:1-aminocyclopropane-1-carboxylate deaminase/D-cysteine desulfhydrase-like pyridoxal-dependent ACC family enzyme
VSQNIEPKTDAWFSDLITPESGNAEIERKAFAVASYGKQLGLLTDVLIEMAEQAALSPDGSRSLERLREIKASIDEIKESTYRSHVSQLTSEVQALRARGGAEYEQLSQSLLPLLANPGA